MRIREIETFQRDPQIAMVRVRTDEGLEGVGQVSPHGADLSVPLLHKMVAPFFLGRDPWDIDVLASQFVEKTYKFPSSLLLRALCGIDTAIWDLLGKASEQPVYKLLGGRARDRVPVYASSMRRDISPGAEGERLQALIDRNGFQAVKVRIGQVNGRDVDAAPGRTETLIPAIREALGDDVAINADANGAYSVSAAIRVGRMLEDYGYHHFEEPCPYQQIENTAEVARVLDIPVAGGEQDMVLEQVHRMITQRAVDIIQPDIGYLGGMARARRVVHMAEAAGIPCTPHCANLSLLQVFTLHLAMASPSISQFQEWSIEEDSWARDLYHPVPEVVNGAVAVSDAPGWGVEIDQHYLTGAERRVTTA